MAFRAPGAIGSAARVGKLFGGDSAQEVAHRTSQDSGVDAPRTSEVGNSTLEEMDIQTTIKWPSVRDVFRKFVVHCELRRLRRRPRHSETITNLLGAPFSVPDAASFLHGYEEIVIQNIYAFTCPHDQPRIIDCGANVGLSVLNFRRQHPEARITAFEPDPVIFAVLTKNVLSAGFADVDLIQSAVWDKNGTLSFSREGADAGRLDESGSDLTVETRALSEYLQSRVDFLKMDIEGAEVRVLQSCRSNLRNVQRLFVEYHSFADKPQELSELLALLKETGFRYVVHPAFAARQPFSHVTTHLGMDLQLNIFAFREPASP